jgi:hypothetical protein
MSRLDYLYNDVTGFSQDLSAWVRTDIFINFVGNNLLKDFTLTVPTGLNKFYCRGANIPIFTSDNTNIKTFNFPNLLTGCNNLQEFVADSNSLTAFTYNLPVSVTKLQLNNNRIESPLQYGLTSFTINLSSNSNLTNLFLSYNRLTGITETITGCTSLINLQLEFNDLTTLPKLPNSITGLTTQNNYLTSLTNIPTQLITFSGQNNSFSSWTLDLTGATSLTNFDLSYNTNLTSWTKQFPSSIKNIKLNNNLFTTFNFNYLTGTTGVNINLSSNQITSLLNLTGATGVTTLNLSSNLLTNQYNIIPNGGNFPANLTTLYLSFNNLVNWSTSFTGSTSLKNLYMRNCGLNQTSVNNIICGLSGTSVIGGTLELSNDLNQSNFNSAPSGPVGTVGTGLYCKAILTGSPKNWTVNTA